MKLKANAEGRQEIEMTIDGKTERKNMNKVENANIVKPEKMQGKVSLMSSNTYFRNRSLLGNRSTLFLNKSQIIKSILNMFVHLN